MEFQSTQMFIYKTEHKKYVREIIHHPMKHPGGQMDQLQRYLNKKEEKEQAGNEL